MATNELDHSVLEISERIISERLDNLKVVSGKYTALDTDGHFTSTVKALEICVVNANGCGDKRSINLIAKVLENQKDDYLKLAFRKENEFYCSLIPMYNSISLSRNMDDTLTPNYFGSNISSTNNEPSIILLDNLQYSGYKVFPNRFFDWDLTELIIDKMSLFHAFGIALKQLRSKIFEEDFKDVVEPALRNSNSIDGSTINLKLRTEIRELLQKRPDMEELVPRVDALLEKIDNMRIPQPKNPFCTLIHNDLWKNNILLKYSDESILVDVKFIDFQFVLYNSPIRDLAYFIFSSCSPDIQKEFRKISMFYYECFVENLKKLKCDISEFTESGFVEEVNEFAPTKFKHLILLMKNTPNTFEERLIELVTSHAESDLL